MMQILTTKLFIPRPRPNAIPRPQLTARLDAGRYHRLTLVSAPAGFGKTSLIAEWVAQLAKADLCWLSLDAEDSSFSRFVSYFVAALQTVDEQLGATLLPLLQSASLPSAEEVMTILINELTAGKTSDNQFIFVLDDYHLIAEPRIHQALTFLLSHMPPRLHLVLITRADPPWPLYRLRGRGQITEIRALDLRFTQEETDAFLNQAMQLAISPEEVAILERRTEGWIASLQLVALAMQSPLASDRHAFVTSFAGSDRYVADYLVGEVLEQQPPQIKRFLLQTALLERFCASLCDYVRQEAGSQTMLEQLDAANLFVVPLDHKRRWYRYHHLFADLLRHRWQQSEPTDVPLLHQRACEWYEQNGFVEEAVSHALSARAYLRAAELIEPEAHTLFSQGKMDTLHRWLSELPPTLIYARPYLYLLQGWLLFRTGKFEALRRHFKRSLPTEEASSTLIRGEFLILQAYLMRIDGEFERCIATLQEAMTLVPTEHLSLRMPAITAQGWSYEAQNDLPAALVCHLQTAKIARQANSLTGLLGSLGKLVELYALLGDDIQARVTFEEVMQIVEREKCHHLPLVGLAYLGMGRLYYQQSQWEAAKTHLQEGIRCCRRWGGLNIDVFKGYLLLAQLWQIQGDEMEAQRVLREAQRFGEQQHLPAWAMRGLDTAPLKVSTTSPPKALLDPLTPREKEVLALLAKGRSSPQIAEHLVVGVSTVRTHIKRIYSKLDAHSRHEAISQAHKLGLV